MLNHFIDHTQLESVDSTNDWAFLHKEKLNLDHINAITAAEQTKGRGRFSRSWFSPKGDNIYTSLVFTLPSEKKYITHIGQVMAYSATTLLRKLGFSAAIKWPNDILIEEKKIGGVLTETYSLNNKILIVLGIGLNVNMSSETIKKIEKPATSLFELSKKQWNLSDLTSLLLEQFIIDLQLLEKDRFSFFQDHFSKLLSSIGKRVICQNGIQTISGICQSITREGMLQLEVASGLIQRISAGELI